MIVRVSTFSQAERDRMWELFFGKKYSVGKIAKEYDGGVDRIISAIDSESERRWREKHPNEVNREKLLAEQA